jgi:hypothetical protein
VLDPLHEVRRQREVVVQVRGDEQAAPNTAELAHIRTDLTPRRLLLEDRREDSRNGEQPETIESQQGLSGSKYTFQ